MLDRQIRDAAPRIKLLRRHDRLRRADGHAGTACAAVAGHRIGRRQRHVDKDFAQKKHRASLAVQQQRVLAAPALAAARAQFGFEHRRRVGKDAVAERPKFGADALTQALQATAQHLVVVAAAGIERDDGLIALLQARELDGLPIGRRGGAQVVHARRDHADGTAHQFSRSRTLEAVRCHVGHVAVKAFGQPGR